MLVFSNTKKLEEYGIDRIRDDEQVRILGGMEGKPKYNKEEYEIRTTYSGRQIKQIINQMKLIEERIPKGWNNWQRAKFIYEILGRNISYDHNEENYRGGKRSNLSVIMSQKAICAGYSLLFKEMMDRQGIQCDYIRGIGKTKDEEGKHAWNMLTIDGITFPVDLTWDSKGLRSGKKELKHFGNDKYFYKYHKTDRDEKKYDASLLSSDYIKSIDTSITYVKQKKEEVELSKSDIIELAIEKTYERFKKSDGKAFAIEQVKFAIKEFINKKDAGYFTNLENARDLVVGNITQEDMIDYIIRDYVKNIKPVRGSALYNATNETLTKYGEIQALGALKNYIMEGKTINFTNVNNARDELIGFFTPQKALKEIVMDVVDRQVEKVEERETGFYRPTALDFSSEEFSGLELSAASKAHGISRAIEWMNNKLKNRINPSNRTPEQNDKENYR